MLSNSAQMGIPAAAGKSPIAPGDDAELSRTARRVMLSGARSLALLPAPAKVPVRAVAMALAERLAQLTGHTVMIGDVGGKTAIDAHNDEGPFGARWLRPDVALLAPRTPPAAGEALALVSRLVERASDRCTVLVDLSDLDSRSEQLTALRMVDKVALVARIGFTREADLVELNRELTEHQHLGVLLTG